MKIKDKNYLQAVKIVITLCEERMYQEGKKVPCDDLYDIISDLGIDCIAAYMKASVKRDSKNAEEDSKFFQDQLIEIRDTIAIYIRKHRKNDSTKLWDTKVYIETVIGNSLINIY